MASPVAFSASDFIATLTLVHDVIGALRNDTNTSRAFLDLMHELYSLERALMQVKSLKASPGHEPELNAIKHAAVQCQATIDRFLDKDKTFRPLPGHIIKKHRWKAGLHRFHWQVSKKHHIDQFRAALATHSSSISMMLSAFQTQSMNTTRNRADEISQQILSRLNDTQETSEMQHNVLLTASSMIHTMSESQGCNDDHLLEMTNKILQAILHLQDNLPRQVMMQKPVYFEDARGIMAPFYLEFITSKEAFVFFLADRFKTSTSVGARRVEQGLFAISDAATNRDLDLNIEWSRCFRPRQVVKMTMLFSSPIAWSRGRCPRCCTPSRGDSSEEVECARCGMLYRQVEIEANSKSLYFLNDNSGTRKSNMKAGEVLEATQITSRWSALDESEDVDATKPTEQNNDVVEYSRVRLLSQPTPRWDVHISDSALSISSDGLEIESHLSTELDRSGQNGTTAYSSRLVPTWNKTQCLCYSEVEILNEVEEGSAICISIGEFVVSTHGISNKDVVAYHDSGRIDRNDYKLLGNWGSYTQGSIVGCGLVEIGDYQRTICAFFTRNGRLVATFNLDPSTCATPLFLASISISGETRIRANFGQLPYHFNTQQSVLSYSPVHKPGRYAAWDGHPIGTSNTRSMVQTLKAGSTPNRRRPSGLECTMDFRYGLSSAKRQHGVY